MSYDVIVDRIEVRSLRENNIPKYIVKGNAIVANKKDIYEYSKNSDGTFRTLKSMFTPNCIKSIKEQSKHKKLFVDSQHELALNANIKSLVKDKLTPIDEKKLDSMLKTKMLPLAKLNDIDIDGDILKVDTELNPVFREVDLDHQKYFDAIWYSLENKYLNGVSVNFANPKIIDDDGEVKIDDIDVLGFSYVDAPAFHGNSIFEVAIRAMQEGIQTRTGEKMNDEIEKLNSEKSKLEEERKQVQKEKEDLLKQKADMEKKSEIEKQASEQKRVQEDLQRKTDELKKSEEERQRLGEELNRAKGIAGQQDKFSRKQDGKNYDDKFYNEKLKEITSEHDKTIEVIKRGQKPMIDRTMKGFAELVNLQAKAGNLTADLDRDNAEYARQNRLLDRSDSDVIANRF